MGRIVDMVSEDLGGGAFKMTPIPGIPHTLAEFIEQWGPSPLPGPAKIDLDRFRENEKDVPPEKVGQPRILAGKNGPYIRIFSLGFRHFEAGQSYPSTHLGSVQQVTQKGQPTLDWRPKLPRRRNRRDEQSRQPAQTHSPEGHVGQPSQPTAAAAE